MIKSAPTFAGNQWSLVGHTVGIDVMAQDPGYQAQLAAEIAEREALRDERIAAQKANIERKKIRRDLENAAKAALNDQLVAWQADVIASGLPQPTNAMIRAEAKRLRSMKS